MKKLTLFGILFLLNFKSFASENVNMISLSQGSCLYENKDPIKLISFPDKINYAGSRSQLESEIEELLNKNRGNLSKTKWNDLDLTLHCGAYGMSIVAKANFEGSNVCLWTKLTVAGLETRSYGGIGEKQEFASLCEGYKFGELIVGLANKDSMIGFKDPKLNSMIEIVSEFSKNTYKIVLTKEYFGHEDQVKELLEDVPEFRKNLKYIEFNSYRHPIGEFVRLK